MIKESKIREKVLRCYNELGYNCAMATLAILSENFRIDLKQQVIDSATGLNGGGRYGAQCGLIEGALMFIGIWGKHNMMEKSEIIAHCYEYSRMFEAEFGSLLCSKLRPEPFHEDNPPGLCNDLSVKTVIFILNYMEKLSRGLSGRNELLA